MSSGHYSNGSDEWEYSFSLSHVSESLFGAVVERGEEEVSSVVRYGDGNALPDLNLLPDLNEEYVEEPGSFYLPPPSHPQYEGGDNGGEEPVPDVSYETNQVFRSLKDLAEWVYQRAKENGYITVFGRTVSDGRGPNRRVTSAWIRCDRSGVHHSVATVRKTGSKKCNCPFQLIGRYHSGHDGYILEVQNQTHNHKPFQHIEGHAYARRLGPAELKLVDTLYFQNVTPVDIHSAVRKQNPDSHCILRDIHNTITKVKHLLYGGRTQMQVLEATLVEKKFVYFTRRNASTNAIEDILFVHPTSHRLWRAFPHVLMIDATYKTNEHKLPFIQVVGMTSTSKSFIVAHAFISREKKDNYLWVIQRLKELLEDSTEPRAIVTDCEKALMNACDIVFPAASKLLCRWHIQRNILKHCRQAFGDEDWKIFVKSFKRLCRSSSPAFYQHWLDRFYRRLCQDERTGVFKYIDRVWLRDYKERFVSAWTDTNYNFGQYTTNRAESQHSRFKMQIKGPNNSLYKLVMIADDVVTSQERAINHSFEESLSVKKVHHDIPIFEDLLGKVSHAAIEKMINEIKNIEKLRKRKKSCGHQLFASSGLPCACRLDSYINKGIKIQLSEIDVFWTRLNYEPEVVWSEPDLASEWEIVKETLLSQSPRVQRNMLSKIKSVVNPSMTDTQPPEVQKNTRGRPTTKSKKKNQQEDAQEDEDEPVRRRRPSDPGRDTMRVCSKKYPLLRGDRYKFVLRAFKHQIDPLYRRFVTHIQDVQPDGNCGFRSVAVALDREEEDWDLIRHVLKEELMGQYHEDWYEILNGFDDNAFARIYSSIDWRGLGDAPNSKWMEMPLTGLVIAQAFGVVLQFFSPLGACTFFPIHIHPESVIQHRVISMAFVNGNHFIMLKLADDAPMPYPSGAWRRWVDVNHNPWLALYRDRLDEGRRLSQTDPEWFDLTGCPDSSNSSV